MLSLPVVDDGAFVQRGAERFFSPDHGDKLGHFFVVDIREGKYGPVFEFLSVDFNGFVFETEDFLVTDESRAGGNFAKQADVPVRRIAFFVIKSRNGNYAKGSGIADPLNDAQLFGRFGANEQFGQRFGTSQQG